MAIDVKPILRAGLVAQAANLVLSKRKKKKRSLIGNASNIIVGTSLIQAESDIIGGL